MNVRALLTLVCTALVACAPTQQQKSSDIAPEDVLDKAAKATQTLESAQYVLEGDFDATTETTATSGTMRLDGVLRNAGEQLRFQFDTDADVQTTDGNVSLTASTEMIVLNEDEVYLNVHSFQTQPSAALIRPEIIGNMAGTWWLLPKMQQGANAGASVTPDPTMLRAQAQVVRVTKDRGISTVGGRDVHVYDVELDIDKLVAYLRAVAAEQGEPFDAAKVRASFVDVVASGQLKIDTETYYVQSLRWVIQSFPVSTGSLSASFTITFRNHNNAPDILPPENPQLFSPAVFFALPQDAFFEEQLQNIDTPTIDNDVMDDILLQVSQ